MEKPLYRVTENEIWLQDALTKVEHILEKKTNGDIFCHTHQNNAMLCADVRGTETVLQNNLDGGTYALTVVRIKPYTGLLTLTRGDEIILEKVVGLSYDAPFGPDAEDVQSWYDLAIEGADKDYRRRGESPPAV